jgi:hypothetical protein
LVGRSGFKPATNGLKVNGSGYENLNIQRLAMLAKLDSQRHSRVEIVVGLYVTSTSHGEPACLLLAYGDWLYVSLLVVQSPAWLVFAFSSGSHHGIVYHLAE